MVEQNIKLYYFDMGGRAEPIRLALTIGGVQFEDIRLTGQQFGEKKGAGFFKFGQMPVVEIGGKQYAQSRALGIWSSRVSGLYPTDSIEVLRVEESVALRDDLLAKVVPTMSIKDNDEKLKAREAYVNNNLKVGLAQFEKLLADNGNNGYVVGNKLTSADLEWYTFLAWHTSGALDGIPKDFLKDYPHAQKVYNTVDGHAKVKAWNEAHQKKQ